MVWRTILLLPLVLLGDWIAAEATSTSKIIYPVFRSIRFIDKSHGWLSGYRGVFYTSNGGITWQRQAVVTGTRSLERGLPVISQVGCIAWADKSSAVVRTDQGIAIGTVAPQQWRTTLIPKQLSDDLKGITLVDGRQGWAGGGDGRVWRTNDAGITWDLIQTPESVRAFIALLPISIREVWFVGTLGSLVHTKDAGKNWEHRLLYGGFGDLKSIQFINDMEGWICGNFGLILHSADAGKSWHLQTTPFGENVWFYSLSFVNQNEGWVVGWRGLKGSVILHTTDGGNSWVVSARNITDRLLHIQALPNGIVWTVGEAGTVLTTSNHGKNWLLVNVE